MGDILERVLGGSGAIGGIFGEAREALVGGCWGLFMSAGFLFLFFATGLALFFGVQGLPIEVDVRAISFPLICLLGVSAILSPVVGALFGAQSGVYRVTTHLGCFTIYIAIVLGAIIWLSI
ncbi:MAG: hypothetical protein Phog2KO_44690 [Phototrophicaceae bacterium]